MEIEDLKLTVRKKNLPSYYFLMFSIFDRKTAFLLYFLPNHIRQTMKKLGVSISDQLCGKKLIR